MSIGDELRELEERDRKKKEQEKTEVLEYHLWHIQGHAYDLYQKLPV